MITEKEAAQEAGIQPPQVLPSEKKHSLEGGHPVSEHAEGDKSQELDENGLPRPENVIEALGIPNWREIEKKAVRRLDLTLLPALWSLYLFNYLDRASLA